MADNIAAQPDPLKLLATDEVTGVHFARSKIALGGDGVDDGNVSNDNPLPVKLDAASLAALESINAAGPLTNAELRAAAVPVSFTWAGLTDAQLRATPVAVSLDAASLAALETVTVGGTVAVSNLPATQAVSVASLPLPSGAAQDSTLAALSADIGDVADAPAGSDSGSGSLISLFKRLLSKFTTYSGIPDNQVAAPAFRMVGQDIWNCSFSDVGASIIADEFNPPIVGTGVGYSQAGGALLVTTGTTARAEFLARSARSWRSSLMLACSAVLSQRIANNNFLYILADLLGEGLDVTINSATSISVAVPGHGFTSRNVGQFMFIGGIVGAAGVPGRFAIASIPDPDTINFTVAGWPASGSCTATLFGHSHYKHVYAGTTATQMQVNSQRRGWADTDTTATISTTANPGHIVKTHIEGRSVEWADSLRASSIAPTVTTRASRIENLPDDNLDLYLFLWSYNGTTAPASSTTWTISFCSIEKFAAVPVYDQGSKPQGQAWAKPVQVASALPLGNNRIGFICAHGIWYDDSSAVLAAGASFTGTSRDLTASASGSYFASSATAAKEIRVSAESDQTGILWLEVSRDGTNWRRVKSVATDAVSGGGFYAEINHRPSQRYARVGFTNGATIQTRFFISSILMTA